MNEFLANPVFVVAFAPQDEAKEMRRTLLGVLRELHADVLRRRAVNEAEQEDLHEIYDPFKMNITYRVYEHANRGGETKRATVDRTLGVRLFVRQVTAQSPD